MGKGTPSDASLKKHRAEFAASHRAVSPFTSSRLRVRAMSPTLSPSSPARDSL